MIEPAFKNMEDIHWASQQVEEALLNMIKDERGQWLLSAEHQQQHNEYALTGVYTGKVVSIKIDRTFIDQDGTRWIIDYKTSRHEEDVDAFLDQQHDSMDGGGRNASGTAFEERYREQLEKYGALMKLQVEEPIKLGLYFPLLQGWREWECKH